MADQIIFERMLNANGDPISGGKARIYETGTTNDLTTYQETGLSTPHANPIIADSEGRLPQAFHDGSTVAKVVYLDASDVELDTFDPARVASTSSGAAGSITATPETGNAGTTVQAQLTNNTTRANVSQNAFGVVTSAGTANAYTITPAVTASTYSSGHVYRIRIHAANTGASTLAVSGGTVTDIQKLDTTNTKTDLVAGDLRIGDVVTVWYDGSEFVVIAVEEANRLAEVSLTDAATIALDLSTGINFTVTLAGARTLGNATNGKVGQRGVIKVVQDGTGSRTLAFDTEYAFRGDVGPLLDDTASSETFFEYYVAASDKVMIFSREDALNAHANITHGGVGTYAFLGRTGSGDIDVGETRAGSNLAWAGMATNGASFDYDTAFNISNNNPSGTWMALCQSTSSSGQYRGGLMVRIA